MRDCSTAVYCSTVLLLMVRRKNDAEGENRLYFPLSTLSFLGAKLRWCKGSACYPVEVKERVRVPYGAFGKSRGRVAERQLHQAVNLAPFGASQVRVLPRPVFLANARKTRAVEQFCLGKIEQWSSRSVEQ